MCEQSYIDSCRNGHTAGYCGISIQIALWTTVHIISLLVFYFNIMAERKRDSDLSSELYFSVYGKNLKLKPQNIKSYALYKPLFENTTANNFVVADNEKNEIFICFNDGLESRVFTFDKVFYGDISQDDFYLLNKSAIQDVIMGANSFIILSKLASFALVENNKSSKMDFVQIMVVNVLKELLIFLSKDENKDCALHVSCFEIHDDKLLDLLSDCDECREAQIYGSPEKDYVELKNLTEKPVICNKDINELVIKKVHTLECSASCCHFVVVVSFVRRNINNEGLEFIKTGKLTLVGPAECKDCLESVQPSSDDCLLKISENGEYPISCNNNILNILKPALTGKVTTTVITLLSSVLCVLEKDLKMLQFASEIRNSVTHPEIDLQLIIRDSTKEYAEEIKELQKCFEATSKGTGVRIDYLSYRSSENAVALEKEKVKNLNGQLLGLTDSINFKKQEILRLQAALESKDKEIDETEKSSEILKSKLNEMNNDNTIQKVSLKADEIIDMKKMILSNEQDIKELKLQLIKTNRNYHELVRSIHFLKDETASLLCDIDAQSISQKNTLELLIVDMNNTYSVFQQLENDLQVNLKNFDIDTLIQAWKNYMQNSILKFSSFVHEKHEDFTSGELYKTANSAVYNAPKDAAVDTIKNIWSEKGSMLKYYFSKLEVFCDSSFKVLAEVIRQMGVMESCYKAELKAIAAALDSTNEAFKKFVCNMNEVLASFQQYFSDLGKELSNMANVISFHQMFRKQFSENIDAIQESLFNLKQTYLDYSGASSGKWHEMQKTCGETIKRHNDLSDYLLLFRKEMSKCLDNLPQQKMSASDYSPVENQMFKLLQIHNEMKGNFREAFTIYKKGMDEEFMEIKKYVILRRTEQEKHFSSFSVQLKAMIRDFLDELRRIPESSTDVKDKIIDHLNSLSTSASYCEPIFNNFLSTSNSILAKSQQCFEDIPSVSENKKDGIPNFENLFLEEWDVTTSTPIVLEKKELNISQEKEKLISRIKSLAEQQISQKPNISVLEYEEKGNKNLSTVSLPNFGTNSKAASTSEKSCFPKFFKK